MWHPCTTLAFAKSFSMWSLANSICRFPPPTPIPWKSLVAGNLHLKVTWLRWAHLLLIAVCLSGQILGVWQRWTWLGVSCKSLFSYNPVYYIGSRCEDLCSSCLFYRNFNFRYNISTRIRSTYVWLWPLINVSPNWQTVARQWVFLFRTLHVHSGPFFCSRFTVYVYPLLSTSFLIPFWLPPSVRWFSNFFAFELLWGFISQWRLL